MEPFKIYILGCGSALPTLRHNPSSQVVSLRGKMFMIDCGEGTQVQLRRSKIHFMKIERVFLSHLHGDHCLGLIGMVSTFGMLGRIAPLHVHASAEYETLLNEELRMFCPHLEYEVVFHAVDTSRHQVVFEDRSLTVESIPLEHRINCCGYLFREKPLLPHIRRDMIDYHKIPVSEINNIKNGAGWTTAEGKSIPNHQLVTPADPPRSYAYCSDTRYMPQLYRLVKNVNVLYHESTYAEDHRDQAKIYYHSTAAQAAQVARDAQVGKLLLGHYSQRYEDETPILSDAKKIFPDSFLTNEGMIIDVK